MAGRPQVPDDQIISEISEETEGEGASVEEAISLFTVWIMTPSPGPSIQCATNSLRETIYLYEDVKTDKNTAFYNHS